MSRFIITDAQIINVEALTSRNNNPYWRIHFTMNVKGRNGQSFPKNTNIACFEADKVQAIQPGQICDIKGSIGVNKDGYLQMNFEGAVAKSAPPVQPSHPSHTPQMAQQPAPAPAAPGPASVPSAPGPASVPSAPVPQAPQPAPSGFDDDIPF